MDKRAPDIRLRIYCPAGTKSAVFREMLNLMKKLSRAIPGMSYELTQKPPGSKKPPAGTEAARGGE